MDPWSQLTRPTAAGCARDEWIVALLQSLVVSPRTRAVGSAFAALVDATGLALPDDAPSVEAVTAATGLSGTTVGAELATLAELGWLLVEDTDAGPAYQLLPASLRPQRPRVSIF